MSNRALLNLNLAAFECSNAYGFPDLFPVQHILDFDSSLWVDFETAKRQRDTSRCIHFFIDDYKFQCLWNQPNRYIDFLARQKCVIMPDFSTYLNSPLALQIFNKYRNHWLGLYYSINDVRIIPCVLCNESVNFPWIFLGLPQKSVIAISDIGVGRGNNIKLFHNTYDEMIRQLNPIQILYFTRSHNAPPDNCTVIRLPYLKGGD